MRDEGSEMRDEAANFASRKKIAIGNKAACYRLSIEEPGVSTLPQDGPGEAVGPIVQRKVLV